MKKEEFIQKIAGYVKKYAAAYEIKVCSPIIAQAILESGWGFPIISGYLTIWKRG